MCWFVPAELGQQRGKVLRLGNDVRGPQQLLELDARDPALVHRLEEVAHVEDADDLVERAAVDGVARVRRFDHGLQRLLGRQVDGERDHLGPRHHHVGDFLVGEVEDLVEHLLLAPLRSRRCSVDSLTSIFSSASECTSPSAPGGLRPSSPQEQLGRALQDPDQRS